MAKSKNEEKRIEKAKKAIKKNMASLRKQLDETDDDVIPNADKKEMLDEMDVFENKHLMIQDSEKNLKRDDFIKEMKNTISKNKKKK